MSSPVTAFCDQIEKDAKNEIERILGKARLSASRKREEAEKEAASITREITQAAEVQGSQIEARAASGVSLETKRMMLRTQGEIIDRVLQGVAARLKALRGTREYSAFLKRLSAQAIIALEEGECVLAPATEDRELYTPQLIDEIKELVERRTGKKVRLTVSQDLSPEGCGVQVYSAARTALFDNTLNVRMERLADELRGIVARELFVQDQAARRRQNRVGNAQQCQRTGDNPPR